MQSNTDLVYQNKHGYVLFFVAFIHRSIVSSKYTAIEELKGLEGGEVVCLEDGLVTMKDMLAPVGRGVLHVARSNNKTQIQNKNLKEYNF